MAKENPCYNMGSHFPAAHCASPVGYNETGYKCSDCPLRSVQPAKTVPINPPVTEYILKVKVLDGNDTFLTSLETQGHVLVLFSDGGAARIEEPDWNEIEDLLRKPKANARSD